MTHILIVSSRYYNNISDALEQGARNALKSARATYELVEVPGALEIPIAIHLAQPTKKFDGFIALGCVIRGETYHFDIVCNESAHGLTWLGITSGAAIGNGILTVENEEQAWERADTAQGNKGRDAALACLRLVELKRQFRAIS